MKLLGGRREEPGNEANAVLSPMVACVSVGDAELSPVMAVSGCG